MKNRDAIKYIRDKAKSAYEKEDRCEICGSTENLELHHFISLTNLLNRWGPFKDKDEVVAIRDSFIEKHHKELYEDVTTLCKEHHMMLHSLFGKTPTNAKAQRRWIDGRKLAYEDR